MSRRRPTKVAAQVTYEKPWSHFMFELFDLVAEDWTPPETVRIKKTARTLTVTAIFRTPAGQRFTAHARARLEGREWIQTEERLAATFAMRPN